MLGHSALGEQAIGSVEPILLLELNFSDLTLVGQTVTFEYGGGHSTVVDTGTLTFTAQNVDFTSPDIVIETVDAASLVYTPQDVGILYGGGATDTWDTGTLSFTRFNITHGFGFAPPAATLTFTAQDISIVYGGGATEVIDAATLTFTPQDINIVEGSIQYTLTVETATATWTAQVAQEAISLQAMRTRAYARRGGMVGRVAVQSGLRAS